MFFLLFCFFFFTVLIVCPTTDSPIDFACYRRGCRARLSSNVERCSLFFYVFFLPKKLKFDYLVFHSFCLLLLCVLLGHASLHFLIKIIHMLYCFFCFISKIVSNESLCLSRECSIYSWTFSSTFMYFFFTTQTSFFHSFVFLFTCSTIFQISFACWSSSFVHWLLSVVLLLIPVLLMLRRLLKNVIKLEKL